ncbi:hypothetical protein LTR10_017075 [Elasticomyces elasticus]|uniref:D-isomer specific 2-hydroxyacid dehydrogenase catalytic domain-containing protein n=1 Tax=Exophiala sideris TaxID=1016849 RepID=A0ABR0IZM7_9EURO|nr:hypothetical protein LTR10_017075 [Elasticomyces elasticus]KAK5023083.1 hypothetical protein LTS07_009576 [Exophiala sideris]KAK5026808.1 hypothetical protein LTR13_009848 [Exophiala sideris]KAK5052461.1 hypothetical protein LTR69_009799 [Exophiala sideris]KAK5178246.1 hypothetical protein LTR44_009330 [Eurotiomycetes sp. CCFEE 6388]
MSVSHDALTIVSPPFDSELEQNGKPAQVDAVTVAGSFSTQQKAPLTDPDCVNAATPGQLEAVVPSSTVTPLTTLIVPSPELLILLMVAACRSKVLKLTTNAIDVRILAKGAKFLLDEGK